MATSSIPASEIVRAAETAVRRASFLREEARRILAEAEAVEDAARRTAIEALGESLGAAAVDMAIWTVTGAVPPASDMTSAGTPAAATEIAAIVAAPPHLPVSSPRDEVPAAVHIAEAAAPVAQEIRHALPSPGTAPRTDFHGVDVPPSRTAEADEIVALAASLIAQGRKTNPFANDRGKNAWRKALFKAAWEHLQPSAAAPEAHSVLPPAETKAVDEPAPQPQATEGAPLAEGAAVVVAPVQSTSATFRGPVEADMADLDEEELTKEPMAEGESLAAGEDIGEPETFEAVPENQAQEPANEPASPQPVAPLAEVPAAARESDPFDDLDEDLPPASTLPAPRGYPSTNPAVPSKAPPPAARTPPRPHAVQSPVPPSPGARAAIPMHTPMPVPPDRRPGNGQVLQRPAPPAAVPRPATQAASSPAASARPGSAPPRRPPSFTSR